MWVPGGACVLLVELAEGGGTVGVETHAPQGGLEVFASECCWCHGGCAVGWEWLMCRLAVGICNLCRFNVGYVGWFNDAMEVVLLVNDAMC